MKLPEVADQESNDWAQGCQRCRFGLIGDTRTDGPGALYEIRLHQAVAKTIRFCDCRAGRSYRAYLLGHYTVVAGKPEYNPKIDEWIAEGMTPTVHFDAEVVR